MPIISEDVFYKFWQIQHLVAHSSKKSPVFATGEEYGIHIYRIYGLHARDTMLTETLKIAIQVHAALFRNNFNMLESSYSFNLQYINDSNTLQ